MKRVGLMRSSLVLASVSALLAVQSACGGLLVDDVDSGATSDSGTTDVGPVIRDARPGPIDADADEPDSNVIVDANPPPLDVRDSTPPPPDGNMPDVNVPDALADVVDAGPGPFTPLVDIDLGVQTPGVPFTFDIPAGTYGFNLTAVATGAPQEFAIETIASPNGVAVHANARPFRGTHETSQTFFGTEAAASVPQSNHPQSMPVASGMWSSKLRGASARVRLQVQKASPSGFVGGQLSLKIHIPSGMNFPGVGALTAATAPGSAEFQQYVDAFFEGVRDAYGLDRGRVTYHDLSPAFRVMTEENLGSSFSATVGTTAGEQALQVVIGELDEENGQFLGISLGIGGPANPKRGLVQSGIGLVFSDAFGFGPAEYASTFAHEFGHYAGLNHTSEFAELLPPGSPLLHDPLEDTAECELRTGNDIQNCPAFDNVMFFAGGGIDVSNLQKRVVQGSPIYRAYTMPMAVPPPPVRRLLAPDFGRAFGHAGKPLSRVESIMFNSFCGTQKPSFNAKLSNSERAELLRLAGSPTASPFVRKRARTLAGR
jgi:hypothetical protein